MRTRTAKQVVMIGVLTTIVVCTTFAQIHEAFAGAGCELRIVPPAQRTDDKGRDVVIRWPTNIKLAWRLSSSGYIEQNRFSAAKWVPELFHGGNAKLLARDAPLDFKAINEENGLIHGCNAGFHPLKIMNTAKLSPNTAFIASLTPTNIVKDPECAVRKECPEAHKMVFFVGDREDHVPPEWVTPRGKSSVSFQCSDSHASSCRVEKIEVSDLQIREDWEGGHFAYYEVYASEGIVPIDYTAEPIGWGEHSSTYKTDRIAFNHVRFVAFPFRLGIRAVDAAGNQSKPMEFAFRAPKEVVAATKSVANGEDPSVLRVVAPLASALASVSISNVQAFPDTSAKATENRVKAFGCQTVGASSMHGGSTSFTLVGVLLLASAIARLRIRK